MAQTNHVSPRKRINPIYSVIIPLLLYLFLRLNPNLDPLIQIPKEHFYIVSIASGLAAIAAVAMGVSGTRLRNLQVLLLSLAFLSLTVIFGLHGLTTPGFLLQFNRVVVVAAPLSLLIMSLWLFLSSLPGDLPLIVSLSRLDRYLIPFWLIILLGFSTYAFFQPEVMAWVPLDESPLKWITTTLTITLSFMTGYRYWRSYRYTQFPLQINIAHAAGLIIASQLIISAGELWRLSWWIYHFLLLLAVILFVTGLVSQYRSSQSLVLAVKGLFSTDPTERLEAGITSNVRALVAEAEARDIHTAGHYRRVAMNALRLGTALNFSPQKLRALAQGAILHDIGKLKVPDELLNKPGKLSTEERAIMQKHTILGYEMCKRLGFMSEVLSIIRSHHEKVDGTGYPDGLKNDQISDLTKLLIVVDVFDALTSDRSYRPAWTHEKAVEYMLAQRGKSFDAEWVDAWVKLISEE